MLYQLSLALQHFFLLLFWTINCFHIVILLLLLYVFWSLFFFFFSGHSCSPALSSRSAKHRVIATAQWYLVVGTDVRAPQDYSMKSIALSFRAGIFNQWKDTVLKTLYIQLEN